MGRYAPASAFLVLGMLLFFNPAAKADTYTWKGVVGDWSNATNWSPAGVPGSADNAIISTGSVNLDAAVNVTNLTMSGGSFIGTESIVVNGIFDWSGGTLSGTGTLTVNGTLNISGTSTKTIGGKSLLLQGTGTWSNGNVSISAGVTFRVASGATLNITHASTQTIGSAATGVFDNLGIVTKSSASTTQIPCIFNNSGSLEITGGIVQISGTSSSTYTGTTALTTGTTLRFTAGTYNINAGTTVSGDGNFTVQGATVNVNSGASFSAAVQLTSGTFNNNATISTPSFVMSNGTYGGSGTTTVMGTFNWSRGTIDATGTLSVSGNADINGSLAKTLNNGTLEITGTATWTNGNINIGSTASLNVKPSAVFSIDLAAARILGSASTGQVNIEGTMIKTTASKMTVSCTFSVKSGGILNINSGTIETGASSSGNHEGTVNLSTGAIFDFVNGATHYFSSGASVSGDGTTRISGAIVQFSAGSSLSSRMEVTAGTITDQQGITPASYTQSGGTFTGAASVSVSGNAIWSGGTISGAALFSVSGTSTFSAGSTRILSERTFSVHGDAFWTGGNFSFTSNAQFNVELGSTLNLDHGSDQSASGSGDFNIYGTLAKTNAAAVTTFSGVAVNNYGSIVGNGIITYSSYNSGGVYAPGFSPGMLTLNTFDNNDAELEIDVASTAGIGVGHDHIAVTGTATLGGTLTVTLLNDFVPAVGDKFQIISASSVVGSFEAENFPALPADRFWVTQYSGTAVTLEVMGLNLPVELVDFQAIEKNGDALLTWQTASETNNSGFDILRSNDAKNWVAIGFVPGQGNSSQLVNYSFIDRPLAHGIFYYRLRQMDFDGKATLSKMRMVEIKSIFGEGNIAKAYPNPVALNGVLFLEPNKDLEGTIQYELFDASGKLLSVGEMEVFTGKISIVLPSTCKGNCLLRLTNGNLVQTISMVIE